MPKSSRPKSPVTKAPRTLEEWRAKRRAPLGIAAARKRADALLVESIVHERLSGWLDDAPELPPQEMLPSFFGPELLKLLALLRCMEGWSKLEEIDDFLTKHGKKLSKKQKKVLEDAAQNLWESLVESGC
jgi:hypothetical protein